MDIRSTDPLDNAEEIIKLRTRFEIHLDEYRAHVLEEERRYMQVMMQLEATSNNITNLTRALELQAHATDGLVKAWNDMSFIQKFALWLTGFSGVGFLIAWYNDLLPK